MLLRRVSRAVDARVRVVSLDRKLGHLVLGRALGDVRAGVVACATALPFADDRRDLVSVDVLSAPPR